jgi:hypothetical protein
MFRDLASGVNYSTICVSIEIKKDPKGTKRFYQRACCHKIQNGRYEMDVYLYDEGGDLVALIKQTTIVTVLTEGKLKDTPDELRKLFKLSIEIADKFKNGNIVIEFNFILQEHYAQSQSPVPITYLPLLSAEFTNLTISNV